jgi:hypothetical protein
VPSRDTVFPPFVSMVALDTSCQCRNPHVHSHDLYSLFVLGSMGNLATKCQEAGSKYFFTLPLHVPRGGITYISSPHFLLTNYYIKIRRKPYQKVEPPPKNCMA